MRSCIPDYLHKDLYYTLFESHLSYCISAWGGVNQNKISTLFTTQKNCLRILFGDREAFLDKFRTCARARPLGAQVLGEAFYRKEHTKPLFKAHSILSVQNLYSYHCFMDIFKILKFRTPMAMHSKYSISLRKNTTLITPDPSYHFFYKSAQLWNIIRPQLKLYDYSVSISQIKSKLKKLLSQIQQCHDEITWVPDNFSANKLGCD